MIFVRDKGRMCNNMLQYGHAYAWAREHNRSVLSMRFSHKYRYFRLCMEPKHNFFSYLLGKYAARIGLIPTIGFLIPENIGSQDLEQQMLSKRHIVLEGWYVRYYNLFLKYKDEIIHMFAFKKYIHHNVKAYIRKKTNATDIFLGVHIRRGDYKTFCNGQYYYTDEVYIDFIKEFARAHYDHHVSVFICSNDIHIDKERYIKSIPECNVCFHEGNPAEDLCLLSECNYLIGAPSTFSLVAAMYHDIPLLWIHTADSKSVTDETLWGKFDKLFKEII